MKLLLAVTCVVAVACSDSKPKVEVTKDNLCDQIAKVACYDMYRCCDDSQIESTLMTTSVPAQASCEDTLRGGCEQDPELVRVQASVAAGHMAFDAAALNTCLTALLEPADRCASSDATPPWAAACMTVAWTGVVPINGMCDYSDECADPSTYCATSRTCVPRPHNGQPCNPGGCTPGTYCDPGNVCRTDVAHGGACTADVQCGDGFSCAVDGSCRPAPVDTAGDYCTAATVSIGLEP